MCCEEMPPEQYLCSILVWMCGTYGVPAPLRNRLPIRLNVSLKSADPALSMHRLPGLGAGLRRVLTAHPHLLRLNLLQFILQINPLLN